ncbi:MAG: amino acid ABC transporter substrate-binding protein [Spirulinaceae cyanobacterium SM2_1_0]|nr:amino acid ABC transporter substrate-binding protein [Spirulinaceae cyanobacterium SM2_1_0]
MKSVRQLWSSALAAVLSVVALGACSDAGTEQTLVMGTSADYPPYEFIDTSGGEEEIVGFDIDIARAIAAELDTDLKIENRPFDDLIPALQAKSVDFVMAGMSPTAERRELVDFTDIYYKAESIILTRQGQRADSPAALAGQKVGVQAGSIQAEAAAEQLPEAELVELEAIGEIVQAVKAGELDAAVIESTVAKSYTAANPDLNFETPFDAGTEGSAIALPKGSDDLERFNEILKQLQDDGEIERLIQKWFG